MVQSEIHHIALNVSDVKEAKEFYSRFFLYMKYKNLVIGLIAEHGLKLRTEDKSIFVKGKFLKIMVNTLHFSLPIFTRHARFYLPLKCM